MRIATLGPAGTFSEIAAKEFARAQQQPQLLFLPNLQQTLAAIPQLAEIAVVPLENIVEGVVSPVVDSFVKKPLQIVAEVAIPVRFSLVGGSAKPTKIYAQFVAQGQCSEVLSEFAVPIVNTASNSESLQALATDPTAAALVPEHLIAAQSHPWVRHDVTDFEHNVTRFVAVQTPQALPAKQAKVRYKSSFVIFDDADHPGLLVEHLQVFAAYKVNLMSLLSRPTGQRFGHYHFYLECEGHLHDSAIQAALTLIKLRTRVLELGSYADSRNYSSSNSSCS